MQKSRLYELFITLNHKDYKRFDDLVNSPFFNKSIRVKNLWNYLKENGGYDDNFKKELIAEAAFGNNKYNDSNFRMVISAFVRLLEEFYLQKVYEQNLCEKKIRLAEIFFEGNCSKSFKMYINEIETELDKSKIKDKTYWHRKYSLECLKIKGNLGGETAAARKYLGKTTLRNV